MDRSDSRQGHIRRHSERCDKVSGAIKVGEILDNRGTRLVQ